MMIIDIRILFGLHPSAGPSGSDGLQTVDTDPASH